MYVVDAKSISLIPASNIDSENLQIAIPVHKTIDAEKG